MSVTALTTVSSVTPLVRSRSGSTSTWYCRSRWPQIATLATPGIDISRGRIVHFASSVRSICESVFDETPIFSSRLVDDSGERITGWRPRPAAATPPPTAVPARPAASAIRSVPSLRISTTDDSPSTDFDRIVLSPIVPLSAFSSGTLIKLSTSSVESPGASVWTSINGGANSGKTSSGAFAPSERPRSSARPRGPAPAPAAATTSRRSSSS